MDGLGADHPVEAAVPNKDAFAHHHPGVNAPYGGKPQQAGFLNIGDNKVGGKEDSFRPGLGAFFIGDQVAGGVGSALGIGGNLPCDPLPHQILPAGDAGQKAEFL